MVCFHCGCDVTTSDPLCPRCREQKNKPPSSYRNPSETRILVKLDPCPQCKMLLFPENDVCPSCGMVIERPYLNHHAVVHTARLSPSDVPKSGDRLWNNVAASLVTVGLSALVIGCIYFLLHR